MVRENRGRNHPFFAEEKNFTQVIAHRGGAGEFPAETIYAFEQAIEIGSDILEMDIRFTSDGEPVLMHNSNVLETTGTDKRVKEFTADEIQKENAAYWWDKAGKKFPTGAELGVHKLEDVLKKFHRRNIRINIEIKPFHLPPRLIKKFGELLRKYDMTKKVLVASGCYMNLRSFRRAFPEVATSASLLELAVFRALKGIGYTPDCDALQLSSKALSLHFITKEYIDKARRLGLKVHGWTVNQPEEMGRLISIGVDGIITDHPTTLLNFLGRTLSKDSECFL